MDRARTTIDTPLGRYALVATARGLARVRPAAAGERTDAEPGDAGDPAAARVLEAARAAFARYFAGDPDALARLPLDPHPAGTPFQQQVWRALRAIPAGATRSYGALARCIGRPGAARAVGLANRANPVAIAIPCHRVVGSDGRLTGYAGGLERKRWLLAHETAWHGSRAGRAPRQAASPWSPSASPSAPARSRARAATSI